MLKVGGFDVLGISRKDFSPVFILLLNAFTWFYMISITLNSMFPAARAENMFIHVVYYTTVIGSGLIGVIFSKKVGRLRFLYMWMGLGTVLSLIPALLQVNSAAMGVGLGFFWGVSFGLGMPSCLSYFADYTTVENRGRLGGVINLAIFVVLFIFFILFSLLDSVFRSIASAIWRGTGLMVFFSCTPKKKTPVKVRTNPSYASIFSSKSFILYFIPWLMFSLINGLEKPILENFFGPSFYGLMAVEFIVTSLSAFIAGLLFDLIGRKRVILYGFISLGIAYAILGIASYAVISWYFYSIVDGVAWGIFMVAFIMALWGDLSENFSKEKYYMVGGIPYVLSYQIQLLLSPYVKLIPAYAAFSLASFFLFLAVLPLMYAPETLPEKKIELRRLRGYVEHAKKVRDRYLKKPEHK